jgi:hypothetical protein
MRPPSPDAPPVSEEARAQAAAIAKLLNSMAWESGRCDYCPDAPEQLVTDAEGDMESGAGYHGTYCRQHLQLALAMNGHQAQRTANADVLNAKLDAARRKRAEQAAR